MAENKYGCTECGSLDFTRPGEHVLGIVDQTGGAPLGYWREHEQGEMTHEKEAEFVSRYGWQCAKEHELPPESPLALTLGLMKGQQFRYPANS